MIAAEGGKADTAKLLHGFGSGVLETVLASGSDAFRVVYAPPGRCESIQEGFEDQVENEARGASETLSACERKRPSFGRAQGPG